VTVFLKVTVIAGSVDRAKALSNTSINVRAGPFNHFGPAQDWTGRSGAGSMPWLLRIALIAFPATP